MSFRRPAAGYPWPAHPPHPNPFRWQRRLLFAVHGGLCGICGEEIHIDPDVEWWPRTSWHVDHIVPKGRGGPHTWENIQPAHPRCNLRKCAGQTPGDTLDPELIRRIVRERVEDGLSFGQIARGLLRDGIPTATGLDWWHPSHLGRLVNHFCSERASAPREEGAQIDQNHNRGWPPPAERDRP